MSKILRLLCLVSLSLPHSHGQSLPHPATPSTQARATKVSLDLGSVTVWLGMQETDALSAFQRAGYRVMKKPSGETTFVVGNSTTYSIVFKDGRLAYADREWPAAVSDELGAVINALAALASHGATSCSIVDTPLSQPNISSERILIDCGERSLVLAKGKYGLSGDTAPNSSFMSISERIGFP